MLRKSVETRDWVNTIEPRNVRAVMKRVVEDTTSIDVQVTPLLQQCRDSQLTFAQECHEITCELAL